MENSKNLLDLGLISYALIILVTVYGFCLFEWWRRKVGKASEVYIYIELLFLTTAINYFFNLFARYNFLSDPNNLVDEPYEYFITGSLWKVRAIPSLIILSLIVYRMTLRACKSIRESDLLERRRIKRREEDRKLRNGTDR